VLLILVAFTAAEFRLLLAQGLAQKHGSGVFPPVHGSWSIQPLPVLRYRALILLKRKIIKPSFKIILVKVSCLCLIYFKDNDEKSNSRSEFKCWAEKSTAGETGQRNLIHHAEGLTSTKRKTIANDATV
jgi:hypothetical protein